MFLNALILSTMKFYKKMLEIYGIADNELHWFSSYLENCQQMVFFQQESFRNFRKFTVGYHRARYWVPYYFLCSSMMCLTLPPTDVCYWCNNLYLCSNLWWPTTEIQRCIDNIYQWYFRNKSTINKIKSAVMIRGGKMQLQSLNIDQFQIKSNQIYLYCIT